jgi:hypothetical protein
MQGLGAGRLGLVVILAGVGLGRTMPVAVARAMSLRLAWMRLGLGLDALGLFRLGLLGLRLGLLRVGLRRLGLGLLLVRLLSLSLGLLLMSLGVPLGGLRLHMLLASLAGRLIAPGSVGLRLLLVRLLNLSLGLLLMSLGVPLGGLGLHMLLAILAGGLIAPGRFGPGLLLMRLLRLGLLLMGMSVPLGNLDLGLLLAARFVLGAGCIRPSLLRAGLIDSLILAALHRCSGDHAGQLRCGGLPLGALLLQGGLLLARLIVMRLLVMPAAPVGVALLFGGPVALAGQNGAAPGLPLGGLGGLVLLMDGGGIDLARPGQIAGGDAGVARRDVLRHGPAGGVIDHRQFAPVVGIGILRIADQEGLIGPGAIVVVALAVGGLLDHAIGAGLRAPDPGAASVIVDGVVRRAVAEGVAQVIGVVDIAVGLTLHACGGKAERGAGWKLGGRRGVDARRQVALGQRQVGSRRLGLGIGGLLLRAAGGQGQGEGRDGEEAEIAHGVQIRGPA